MFLFILLDFVPLRVILKAVAPITKRLGLKIKASEKRSTFEDDRKKITKIQLNDQIKRFFERLFGEGCVVSIVQAVDTRALRYTLNKMEVLEASISIAENTIQKFRHIAKRRQTKM